MADSKSSKVTNSSNTSKPSKTAPPTKPIPTVNAEDLFTTTLNEAVYAKFDWNSLSNDGNPSGELKAVINGLATNIKAHANNPNFTTHSALYDQLHNLFSAYILWQFQPNIVSLIQCTNIPFNKDCQLLALDILSMHYERLTTSRSEDTSIGDKYRALFQSLVPLFDDTLLKTKTDSKLAWELKLFATKRLQTPRQKNNVNTITLEERRRKTKNYFVQNKFNLLMEESEGFAKLMTEIAEHLQQRKIRGEGERKEEDEKKGDGQHLMDTDSEDAKDSEVQSPKLLQTKIFRLIGQFKLDPNRAIDIILHGLEYDPTDTVLLSILRDNFVSEHIVAILGHQFGAFYDSKCTLSKKQVPPPSLYILTAHLIHHELVALDDILGHFTSTLDAHRVSRSDFEINERERARFQNYTNLNETAEQKQQRETEVVELDKAEDIYHKSERQSPVYQLLTAMLTEGDWKNVQRFLYLMQGIHPESKHFVNGAMMDLLESVLDPLYYRNFEKSSVLASREWMKECKAKMARFNPLDKGVVVNELVELPKIMGPMIAAIHCYLHRRPILYGKICRILAAVMDLNLEEKLSKESNEELLQIIENVMYDLLAAYSLMGVENPGISTELWGILSKFHFTERYKFYGYWKDVRYDECAELWCRRAEAQKDAKYLMKRYHVEGKGGTQKKLGRQFLRFIQGQPALLFDVVLQQLQAYSANVITVVDGLRYISILDRDVFIWVTLTHCERRRDKIRAFDSNYEGWFAALSNILGHFFKIHSDSDFLPILHYVMSKLVAGYCDHLLLFKTIITKLTQIEAFGEVINMKQLNCLAGSELLKQVALQLESGSTSRQSRMIKKMAKTMMAHRVLVPLFILLNHTMERFSFDFNPNEIPSFKASTTMPAQIDICNDMMVQLLLFMKHHIVPKYRDQLKLQFPSLKELVVDHRMGTSYAFLLLRAVHENLREDLDKKEVEEIFKDLGIWNVMTPALFSLFWSLEISDIFHPEREYQQQAQRLAEEQRQLGKDLNKFPSSSAMSDDEYNRYKNVKRKRKYKEECVMELGQDCEAQRKSVAQTVETIFTNRRESWFLKPAPREFLFQCILPRITTSDIDAKFCAKFIELAIKNSVPHFYVMDFAAVWLENMNQILSSSTDSESRRIGRFLSDFMSILERYRADKSKFKEELSGLEAVKHWDESTQTAVPMKYDDFCTSFRSMHRSLTIYFCHLMKAKNESVQKNAVTVLHELNTVYPRVISHAKHLRTKVNEILDKQEKGSSMAIKCERCENILTRNLKKTGDEIVFIDEKKFGGRNLAQNEAPTSTAVKREKETQSSDKLKQLKQQALASMAKNKSGSSSTKTVSGRKRAYSEVESNGDHKSTPKMPSKRSRVAEHEKERDRGSDRGNAGKDRASSKSRRRSNSHGSRDSESGRSSRDRSRDRSKTRGGSKGADRERKPSKERSTAGGGGYERDRDRGDRDRTDRTDRTDRNERYPERGSRDRDGNRGDREYRDRERGRARGGNNRVTDGKGNTWRAVDKEDRSNRKNENGNGNGGKRGNEKSETKSRDRDNKKGSDSNEDRSDKRDRDRDRSEKDRKRSRRRDDRR